MGKGFRCSTAVTGLDLGETIMEACQRTVWNLAIRRRRQLTQIQGLNIRLDAIVNDTSATLLSRAYIDPSTRLAMVLGTGFNAALHLPIPSLHPSKFSSRTMPNASGVSHVLVNTELGMFGKEVFRKTRWDIKLNKNHLMPDYQPLEYLAAGPYFSEIVRLIFVEATGLGLFGGVMPVSLSSHYTLDARLLAIIETDTSHALVSSRTVFQEHHPSATPLTMSDAYFIQQVIRSVVRRSSAFVSVGIHALASLVDDKEKESHIASNRLDHFSIGCDGSIINKYPAYMTRCQELIDQMMLLEGPKRPRIILERTTDSAVCGAGVAVAMAAAHS